MSLTSVGSSNPYSYLQRPLQSSENGDTSAASAPSDPLRALYRAFSGGQSSDPQLAAAGSDGAAGGSQSLPQFSREMMQALLSMQSDQSNSASSRLQSLFGQFDADGNGQISQSEFETAIGTDAGQSNVDALFNKIDANGDGSISTDEMQSAIQKAHAGHHHHHHGGVHAAGGQQGDPLQALLSGASVDRTTSQTATNEDGSTTTTITYADGSKIEMTTPAASADAGSSSTTNSQAPNFANLLKQLISLQAQYAAPSTNVTA